MTNRTLWAAFLLCLMAGCASKNKGKIEGTTWENDSCFIEGKLFNSKSLVLDFAQGGGFKMTFMGQTILNGTYSVGMGDMISLKFDQTVDGSNRSTEKITIEGDVLTMEDPKGKPIKFRKKTVASSGGNPSPPGSGMIGNPGMPSNTGMPSNSGMPSNAGITTRSGMPSSPAMTSPMMPGMATQPAATGPSTRPGNTGKGTSFFDRPRPTSRGAGRLGFLRPARPDRRRESSAAVTRVRHFAASGSGIMGCPAPPRRRLPP